MTNTEILNTIASISGLNSYKGIYTPLGGGEINDTFLLNCSDTQVIVRISRQPNHNTLKNEAASLQLLDLPNIPKIIYFSPNKPVNNRIWIVESYIEGKTPTRLTLSQFYSLGTLLARIHSVTNNQSGVDPWKMRLQDCHSFGDEQYFLRHPEIRMRKIVHKMKNYCNDMKPRLKYVENALVHADVTPSNTLVNDSGEVSLIDWEFSGFKDPMSDFSTGYYSDIEYNDGKWRQHITSSEKNAFIKSYQANGAKYDEERAVFWEQADKFGAALFLYWRIHHSDKPIIHTTAEKYQLEFNSLVGSLEDFFI